ncbi:MAG: DUF2442 domain-containing protein [Acidobacteriota bacterium]
MKSTGRGSSTSGVEVTNISKNGLWLLVGDTEHFLPFEEFPWFREATVGELLNVELPHPHHVHWPDLDVDLAMESIEHPERYPLVSRKAPKSRAAHPPEDREGV